jgi:hypothetical protein
MNDSPKTYWTLVGALGNRIDRLLESSADIISWFSMHYYEPTLRALTNQGWDIEKFPLIRFRSDNADILPDPNRGPRRVHEKAFFGHFRGRLGGAGGRQG